MKTTHSLQDFDRIKDFSLKELSFGRHLNLESKKWPLSIQRLGLVRRIFDAIESKMVKSPIKEFEKVIT